MELVFLGLLFLVMILTLGVGFPVAFALPGSAILTIGLAAGAGWLFTGNPNAYFGSGSAIDWLTAGVTNFRGVYWEADRDTLIAIPLFVFMGIMLQRSKIAEELLVTMARLFGSLPGGLGISVVVVGALLAATTGIVGATVVAMGLISLPAMMRNGYSQPLATGTILASGTLGQIIPPSIVLIILADQLSSAVDAAQQLRLADYRAATGSQTMPSELGLTPASAGDMFMGALFPGLVLVGMYIVYILAYALFRPNSAPAVRTEGKWDRAFWAQVFFATVPPLLLIFLVLGSIIAGVATVTQAGAVGAAGATIMAGYKLASGRWRYVPLILASGAVTAIAVLGRLYDLNVRQLDVTGAQTGVALAGLAVAVLVAALVWSAWRTWRVENTLRDVMSETTKTSALVFVILLGAAMLISAFRAFGGEHLVKDFLTGLPGGFWGQFIIVMAVVFLLGFFLDFIEIAIVVVPIVAPILLMNPEANVTAIWLGVMIGLNIQTSFLTPPFGFALFYLRGVADKTVKTINFYKGVVPFITMQLLSLVIVGYYPALVNYLPARVSLLSENAPPPRNPRLQYCVEEYLAVQIPAQEGTVRGLIAAARAGDLSALPTGRQRDLTRALDAYDAAFGRFAEFRASSAAIAAATPAYRPLHREVSTIRRDIERFNRQAASLTVSLRNYRSDDPDDVATRGRIEARIAALRERVAALEATIPANWEPDHRAFLALNQAELDARRAFRQPTEQAYLVLRDIVAELGAAEGFQGLLPLVADVAGRVGTDDPEALALEVRAIEGRLGSLAGSGGVREALTNLRNALSGRRANAGRALELAPAAVAAVEDEIAWRVAADGLEAILAPLEATTRTTLGLREQERLERPTALQVARCLAYHRDVSLNF
jgi:TRAP-type mannitol/chloroaromatic compound transport system permease large subunit